MPDKVIIVALDFSDLKTARRLVDQLDPAQCRVKVGNEMFTRFGPGWVRELTKKKFEVFLDLKFHDIPNTVANACRACADLEVWMLNLHATGGLAMMEAAVAALTQYGVQRPLLIAVTVLTSLNDLELNMLGITHSTQQHVMQLAQLVHQAQLDGVVCSAHEVAILKQKYGENFKCVTPGIRINENIIDDQQRIMHPAAAIKAGADYLVIGRPITQANDPQQIISQIIMDINKGAM